MEWASDARRLRDTAYAGWDITQATYLTSYAIMVVGLFCAVLLWRQYGRAGDWSDNVAYIYATFCLLVGLCFGFAGIATHILASYHEEGTDMSRQWFSPHGEWLVPWSMAMAVGPLGSACCMGTGLAFSGVSPGWIRAAKCFGILVAIGELTLCVLNIDATGTLSVYWAVLAAVVGGLMLAKAGCDAPGIVPCAIGYGVQVAGYLLVMFAPMICTTQYHTKVVETETGRLYVKSPVRASCWLTNTDFDQNAIFHVCLAVSMLFLYCGVNAKAARDRELSYLQMMRTAYQKDQPGCCGF